MTLKTSAFFFILLFCCLEHISVSAAIFKPSQDSSFAAELDFELAPLEKRVFQPQYHSFKGNGLLGIGWSLLATSSISRCSTTTPHLTSNLNASQLDAFCLDGKILEPIQSGSAYQVTLASGERKRVLKSGNCDASCYFIVTDGKGPNSWGEIRWYGYDDSNSANGVPYFPSHKPVAWSLSAIQLGNEQIRFDHKTNFITDTSLPYSASSTRVDPETNIQTVTDIRFIYQTRKDNFMGTVDGHEIDMANLLTEIQFIPRTDHKDNDASIHKSNVIQFNYELGEQVHEKLLTKVELCEWKETDDNKWQVCQANRLFWTHVTPETELDCDRHWNIPYENYLICDQQRHNYVTLALIDNGNFYNQLHIQYQLNPAVANDSLAGQSRPLLSLSSIKSIPRTGNTAMNNPIIMPFRAEIPSDAQENSWTFEWSKPRELKYGRTTGYNTRKATSFRFEAPTEVTTNWESQSDFGHMVKETSYRKGTTQGTFSCEYGLQGAIQPYVTKRIENYKQWVFSGCTVEKSFFIDPTSFESILEKSNSTGNQGFCEQHKLGERDHNMSAYDGYLEHNSCDLIYSLLDLNISGPQANSTQILFPPDVKNKKNKKKAL